MKDSGPSILSFEIAKKESNRRKSEMMLEIARKNCEFFRKRIEILRGKLVRK